MKSEPDREVLVVEDDPEINELVGAYVTLAGYRYRGAFDGGSAIRQAAKDPPALILLDVMLPDMSGFEVCLKLRGAPATRHIPIVFLSALDGESEKARGRNSGAAEYLVKPFDPDQLIQTIRQHILSE